MRHELRPLFDRVVIKELEPDRIRQSGLLVHAVLFGGGYGAAVDRAARAYA